MKSEGGGIPGPPNWTCSSNRDIGPGLLASEQVLRDELKKNPTGSPQANAKFGWLGRKRLHQKVTQKTIKRRVDLSPTPFSSGRSERIICSQIPLDRWRDSGCRRKVSRRFITTDDLKSFFGACNPEQRRIFSTLLLTGMRKDELENLTWADVHLGLGIIFIQAKDGWNPKSDERIIPISPVLNGILESNTRAGAVTSGFFKQVRTQALSSARQTERYLQKGRDEGDHTSQPCATRLGRTSEWRE